MRRFCVIFIVVLLSIGCISPALASGGGYNYGGMNIVPKDDDALTERESFFVTLAHSLDLCMLAETPTFTDPDQLSDAAKYMMFRVLATSSLTAQDQEHPEAFEAALVDPATKLVRVPVSLVREWLKTYLDTEQFDPELAFQGEGGFVDEDTGVRMGYDPKTDVYTTYMLSGFGGVRGPGLLDLSQTGENTWRAVVGFYDPELLWQVPKQYVLYRTYTLEVRENPDDRTKFTILSAVRVNYAPNGTHEVIDRPVVNQFLW